MNTKQSLAISAALLAFPLSLPHGAHAADSAEIVASALQRLEALNATNLEIVADVSITKLLEGAVPFGTSAEGAPLVKVVDGGREVVRTASFADEEGNHFTLEQQSIRAIMGPDGGRVFSMSGPDSYSDSTLEGEQWSTVVTRPDRKPVTFKTGRSQAHWHPARYYSALASVVQGQALPEPVGGTVTITTSDAAAGVTVTTILDVREGELLLSSSTTVDGSGTSSESYSDFVQLDGAWTPTRVQNLRIDPDGVVIEEITYTVMSQHVLSAEEVQALVAKPALELASPGQ